MGRPKGRKDSCEREEEPDALPEIGKPRPPPLMEELTRPSSKALTGHVHDVALKAALHVPRYDFTPDADFYLSENCEGVWVCASKAAGPEVLQRCCALVRATLPLWQRELWGKFVSPKWGQDPGPMRIIILDNRSGEQANCIPEINRGNSGGRNGTACPFVFTSREDFDGGVGGSWKLGALTAHEMVHGADMVLRQLYDPYFHEEVLDLYRTYRQLFQWPKSQGTGRTVVKNCYACANRDEFLAETHCILLGMHENKDDYCRARMNTATLLEEACPKLVEVLKRVFVYPETLDLQV